MEPRPVEEEFKTVSAVFSGKVIKISSSKEGYKVTFQIDKA